MLGDGAPAISLRHGQDLPPVAAAGPYSRRVAGVQRNGRPPAGREPVWEVSAMLIGGG